MTAKTLMLKDTIGGVLYRSEKQLTRFRDRVRTQRFKNDEIRQNKISQIVHSAPGLDYYGILQTATT